MGIPSKIGDRDAREAPVEMAPCVTFRSKQAAERRADRSSTRSLPRYALAISDAFHVAMSATERSRLRDPARQRRFL